MHSFIFYYYFIQKTYTQNNKSTSIYLLHPGSTLNLVSQLSTIHYIQHIINLLCVHITHYYLASSIIIGMHTLASTS